MSIRVFITDDQRLFRQSLKCLLENESDISVVGEADNGREAVIRIEQTRPDIVLMDVNIPSLDGITAARLVHEKYPHIKILMLSVSDNNDNVVNAMESGAVGYILKDAEQSEFLKIIRSTYNGDQVRSPYLANLTLSRAIPVPKEDEGESDEFNLTKREGEVLHLLSEGKSNQDIAEKLCLSIETVKSHLQKIYQKLNVKNRNEAVVHFLKRMKDEGGRMKEEEMK